MDVIAGQPLYAADRGVSFAGIGVCPVDGSNGSLKVITHPRPGASAVSDAPRGPLSLP